MFDVVQTVWRHSLLKYPPLSLSFCLQSLGLNWMHMGKCWVSYSTVTFIVTTIIHVDDSLGLVIITVAMNEALISILLCVLYISR